MGGARPGHHNRRHYPGYPPGNVHQGTWRRSYWLIYSPPTPMAQVDAILEGNRLALARLLTQVENRIRRTGCIEPVVSIYRQSAFNRCNRCARNWKIDPGEPAGALLPQVGTPRRTAQACSCGRCGSVQPFHRWSSPGRPCADARSGWRPRCIHPLDGFAWLTRRAVRGLLRVSSRCWMQPAMRSS